MHRRQALKQVATVTASAVAAVSLGNGSAMAQSLPQAPRSPLTPGSIHLNQVGYLPSARKIAVVANHSDARSFEVHALPSNATVFSGTLSQAEFDAASGDHVALADFSAVITPGSYRLEVDGLQSDTFTIALDVYRHALYLCARAFYGQRCGCKVNLGDGYKHPECHQAGAFHPTSGRSGKLPQTGGWHDAGDYGRYVVNSGISTGTLLWAWELYPKAVGKLKLRIPESRGMLPDLLAEVRWNLDWMISLQDSDGGVWHKQTSEHFCAFIMPEKDALTSFVIGSGNAPYKTTGATADLAAVAAIAARCYLPSDPDYAAHCLTVARNAWAWAMANPTQIYTNPPGISTGGYDDKTLTDEIMWASAELWRTTGEEMYELAFRTAFHRAQDTFHLGEPGWGNVGPLACWAYVMSSSEGSTDVRDRIRAATRLAADLLIEVSETNGYGNTLAEREYGWGSNSNALNQSLLLLLDVHLNGHAASREVALNNLHYVLGKNCHGISWVTHLGTRPYLHPHHRPSSADGILEPWPGLLSGGPNHRPGDDAARKLPPGPPMRMWVDDERAYSLNEVAINWNAPLVFVLAAANET